MKFFHSHQYYCLPSFLCIVASAVLAIIPSLLMPPLLNAQDFSRPGGELTSELPVPASIQVNAPNVTNEERRLLQIAGFAPFHQIFTRPMGIGPTFINPSCGGCHINNGRGPVRFRSRGLLASTMVVKVGRRGVDEFGSSRALPRIGNQLHDRALGRRQPDAVRLRWRVMNRRYPDGTRYSIRRPVLTFVLRPNVRVVRRRIVSSLRMTPPIIGPGLLEAIPEEVILVNADPEDLRGDGIRGRPNYVRDEATGELVLGRFGFKAAQPTVLQQTAAAFHQDMGLHNSLFPGPRGQVNVDDNTVELVSIYLELAGVPRARNQNSPAVVAGRNLFQEIGCTSCHFPGFTTGNDHQYPELRGQEIFPYSDLLLHNMGRGLADGFREFSARGVDWRTSPLWGIGLARELLGGRRPVYLHDGRARNLAEAIIWHGGEATPARDRFMHLSAAERELLLEFLKSL